MTRKLSIIGLLGVLLLLSVPATWAQEGAASPGNGQPTPGVAEVLPVDGAQQIDPQTPITIVFNRPIVPLTILEEREDLPDPLT